MELGIVTNILAVEVKCKQCGGYCVNESDSSMITVADGNTLTCEDCGKKCQIPQNAFDQHVRQEINQAGKPRVYVNIAGEDGNIYWLFLKSLAALVNAGQMVQALELSLRRSMTTDLQSPYQQARANLEEFVEFVDVSLKKK